MANELRLRSNNQQGVISDNPLSNVATTINSPQFVDLPVVDTTNNMSLILDPTETNGPAEIVQVTAHSAASSQVTAVRGDQGTAARTHVMGTTWFHGPTVNDFNYTQRFALSTNRPPTPLGGEMIRESDTGLVQMWDGSAWRTIGATPTTSPYGAHFQANPPACRVFHNANQSINDNTVTTVTFNSERWDTDSMHSTSVNPERITFNTAGLYIVTFHAAYASAADYDRTTYAIRLNGTTVLAETITTDQDATFNPSASVSTVYKFAASDYVEARTYQDNTANAARNLIVAGNQSPEFSATWIGLG